MIACLTDIMPLRQRVPADVSFAELTARTKAQVWGAVGHRDVPYSHLVRELEVERSPGRFPLFQVVIGLDDTPPGPGPAGRDRRPAVPPLGHGQVRHLPAPGARAGRIRRLPGVLHRPLRPWHRPATGGAAANPADRGRRPSRPAPARPGHPAGRRASTDPRKLGAGARRPAGQPLAHEAFAAQARRTPDAPAVDHGDRVLSYAELGRAADAVAAHLVARGAAGRAPVGLSCGVLRSWPSRSWGCSRPAALPAPSTPGIPPTGSPT